VIRYTNNAAGDLLSLTDGKGQTTRWNYDEYGRVTNKLDQAGTEILRYTYDLNGRLTNRWSLQKGNTRYAYDPVGNLTNIAYPVSTSVQLTYDALNRLTSMVDAAGTTTCTYWPGGLLKTEGGLWANDTVTNFYFQRLRTSLVLQQPTGTWTNGFAYDAAKRLSSVTSRAGSFSYQYRATNIENLVATLTLPNGAAITNDFDDLAHLTKTHLRTSAGALTNKHEYTYNAAGQRTQQTRIDGSTVDYTYDNIGQLQTAAL